MPKRLFEMVLLTCMLFITLTGLASQAAAQQSYFTYVSRWAVPRNEWAAFEKQERADDALMHKLCADGTIVAWGDEAIRVHQEDGYTHAEWFTATSRENLLKTLEQVSGTATNAAYVSTTKHSDLFLHTLAHGGKTASGATGYLRVTFWQAKAGEGDALEGFVMKSIKPTLDEDVANGTLLMYNFDEEDIHTSPPGGYNLALLFRDGAAIDKFFADLAAAEKKDPTVGSIIDSLTVAKTHRDDFGRVTAYEHK